MCFDYLAFRIHSKRTRQIYVDCDDGFSASELEKPVI